MIPYKRNSLKYGSFLRLPKGVYGIDVNFYADKSGEILFPYQFKNGKKAEDISGYVFNVVFPVFQKFSDLKLDISFVIKNINFYTDEPVIKLNTIVYHQNGQSISYALAKGVDGIKIKMGIAPQGETTIEGAQAVLAHEMLHGLGFNHKDVGWVKTRPKYYKLDVFNPDDVHGLDVVYNYDGKYKISGYFDQAREYPGAEVYIISKSGDLCYQTPVDIDGFYEFRLRRKPRDVIRLLMLTKTGDEYLYKITKPIEIQCSNTTVTFSELTKSIDDYHTSGRAVLSGVNQ